MAANKKLGALMVTLLALLAGPMTGSVASAGSDCSVFVGWPLPILRSLICGILGPYTPPSTSPPSTTGAGLSVGYYNNPNNKGSYCPSAEAIVRKVVQDAINDNLYSSSSFGDGGRGIGAGLIRLFFHDAFVEGSDASVLLNTTAAGSGNTEREGPPNKDSLRGFEVIDAAKAATKGACGNVVSCADILAFAARDASDILSNGAIKFAMPAGRLDGRVSMASRTNQLPGPDSDVQQLEKMFAAKGLSRADMVTLSGAHSIGRARCLFFTGRLTAMNDVYAGQLNKTCSGSHNTRVDQDLKTPVILDNQYYKNIDEFVLFGSDAALKSSEETFGQVRANAANASKWESDFAAAMLPIFTIAAAKSLSHLLALAAFARTWPNVSSDDLSAASDPNSTNSSMFL